MAQAAGGLTVPEVFGGTVRHLYRPAQVIILKELRNFHEPGSAAFSLGSSRSEADLFSLEAEEFLAGSKPVLVQAARLTDDANEQYVYYMHVAQNVTQEQAAQLGSTVVGNVDIATISIDLTVEGTSTAEITLRNPNDRYTYMRHPLKKGKCLFEQNDLVWVDLPDLNGQLRRTFTGMVTAVTAAQTFDGSINNLIMLSCEDRTKILKQNRTNIRPSANLAEAGQTLSGFENRFQGKRVHEVLEEVLGLAYSKFYVSSAFQQRINGLRQLYTGASSDRIRGDAAQSQTTAFLEEIPSFTEKRLQTKAVLSTTATGTSFTAGRADQQVPQYVLGFQYPQGVGAPETPSELLLSTTAFGKNLFKGVLPLTRRPSDLAWAVVGTSQPAYQLTVAGEGAVDFYISEWKSNYALIQEMAKVLLFEFFADPRGVVWFRPMNVALPASAPKPDSLYEEGRPGSVYWIDPQAVVRKASTFSDAGLVTVQYVRGRWYYGNMGEAPWMVGGAVDSRALSKFGPRQGPQWQVTGLQTPQACSLYAENLLTRINAGVDTSSVTLKGDSRMEPGNFCYHAGEVTCYYLTRLRHDYAAGGKYDMSLTLTYGRPAIAMTSKKMLAATSLLSAAGYQTLASEMKTKTISKVIQEMAGTGDIDPITRLPATNITRAARLRKYTNPLDTDKTLIVDGYYFSDMSEFLYETVMEELPSARLASEAKSIGENFLANAPTRQATLRSARAAAAAQASSITSSEAALRATASDVNRALKEISGKTQTR